jgi:hypothetical protein
MPRLREVPVLLLLTGLLVLGMTAAAGAQTFTVTRTDDPVPGPCLAEDCSLREAMKASNESTTVDDVVVVPAAAAQYEIDLGSLEIEGPVEVRGAGADRVVLDAGGNSIAVGVGGSGVVLEGLAISGGLGGIQNNGELTLRGVAVEHNDRKDGGGGGVQSNGPLVVESSFIGFNTSNGAAGSAIQSNDPLTVSNSTLASNSSQGPAIQANVETRISSSAIVFNTTVGGTEAAGFMGNGPVVLSNSIVAGNSNPEGTLNCSTEATVLTSLGGNIEDFATCGLGARDRTNVAPGLGALALHGGTTSVYELLPSSPAVDFAVSCPVTDQRGVSRPRGAGCDSGPFELEPAPPTAAARDESVTVLIGHGKVHIDGKGFGRIRLTCPSSEQSPPCSGVLFLVSLPVRPGAAFTAAFARAKFRIGAGVTKRVKVHLTSRTVDGLRKNPASRKVSASARVADAAGNHSVTAKRRLHLVPPKKR